METNVVLPNYSNEKMLATINDEIWDDNKFHLTLGNIWVSKELRGQGFGEQLFLEILNFMRQNKHKILYFSNTNIGFWNAMKNKYPQNVQLYGTIWGKIKQTKRGKNK